MKKPVVSALAILVFILAFSGNLAAELRIGAVTDKSLGFDPFQWTAGLVIHFELSPAGFDFRKQLMKTSSLWLSPEIYFLNRKFDFGTNWIAPGILLNYQNRITNQTYYMLGAGLAKFWRLGPEVPNAPSTSAALKMEASVLDYGMSARLGIFVMTPFNSFFSDLTIGITFGFFD